MSYPHAGLGILISDWIAKRAIRKTLAHLDDHLLRDIGLHDHVRGRPSKITSWPSVHHSR